MIKILIGGSPCTHWSIAQKNNRETEAEGIGWELFENYLIAKEKFQPDYFLYENNKSAAQPIKDQISKELGAPLQYINSALVSAQNRQRFYAHNIPGVELPEDRGILLRDILESGVSDREKSYCLGAGYGRVEYQKWYKRKFSENKNKQQHDYIFEPVESLELDDAYFKGGFSSEQQPNLIGKIVCNNTSDNNGQPAQGTRIYSPNGKSICLDADNRKYIISEIEPMLIREATKQGYAEIYPGDCVDMTQPNSKTRRGRNMQDKSNCLMTSNQYYQYCGTTDKPIYEVRNGLITIKGKQYPIKLIDGYYIIRKLTVTECKRLQTVPGWYQMPCSASQNYKMLGNGWTVEVIKHILSHIPNIQNEEIQVLSMYDGMSCGQIVFKELGCNVVNYYATEIDKYAIQTTMANFPDTIQLGDAFQVREWSNQND